MRRQAGSSSIGSLAITTDPTPARSSLRVRSVEEDSSSA
jgi:hypothetical protein